MSQLTVRLLGTPTVEWDSEFRDIPRRKVRALFYRLAVDMRPVAREHLAYLFWASQPDAIAHRDLTHLITHLRCALPAPEILQCTADFLFVDSRRIWCDTGEFLRLLRAHHVQPTAALLAEAAALVRGSLLDGFALNDCPEFEEWLTIERCVWEHRQLAVLDALQRESRASGELSLVIQAAQVVSSDDRTDVETPPTLVQVRLAAGDVELVRRQLEPCRELLDIPRIALANQERTQ